MKESRGIQRERERAKRGERGEGRKEGRREVEKNGKL